MKQPTGSVLISLLLISGFGFAVRAAGEDGKEAPTTVRKTSEGLHFQLPPDWPVEKRGSLVGPIPVEEYLARKLGVMEQRLQAMEQQVGALDVRLRVLEEAMKRPRLQSKEGAP